MSSSLTDLLIRELSDRLPKAEDLAPYIEKAVTLDGSPEAERVRGERCTEWVRAVTDSERPGPIGRLGARVLEDAREVEEAVDAALLTLERRAVALMKVAPADPLPFSFRIALNRCFAAVKTAEKLAAEGGWTAVAWRDLLDRVTAPI